MGTSPTPEFWKLFAILLVISTAVGFVLSAVVDALVVRARRRRTGCATPPGAHRRQETRKLPRRERTPVGR